MAAESNNGENQYLDFLIIITDLFNNKTEYSHASANVKIM
jgi:hypothetical protein